MGLTKVIDKLCTGCLDLGTFVGGVGYKQETTADRPIATFGRRSNAARYPAGASVTRKLWRNMCSLHGSDHACPSLSQWCGDNGNVRIGELLWEDFPRLSGEAMPLNWRWRGPGKTQGPKPSPRSLTRPAETTLCHRSIYLTCARQRQAHSYGSYKGLLLTGDGANCGSL